MMIPHMTYDDHVHDIRYSVTFGVVTEKTKSAWQKGLSFCLDWVEGVGFKIAKVLAAVRSEFMDCYSGHGYMMGSFNR